MLLKHLMEVLAYTEIINRSGRDLSTLNVNALCFDSRKASEGALFVCISGTQSDGHAFAKQAYDRQCRIFVAEHPADLPDDAVTVVVPDTRIALAELSAAFFDYPARELTVVGITGTKGKTTSSLLIYNILCNSGVPAGYIGSNGIFYKDRQLGTVNTTPESYDLHRVMRDMRNAGIRILVMEVSSQALKMARVHGISFHTCVFTNLSPDHIGKYEHPDFDDYKRCKQTLFSDYGAQYVVYNADDEHAADMIRGIRCPAAGISIGKCADYRADSITYFRSPGTIGVSFDCTAKSNTFPVSLSFPGEFSVYNAMTAIAVCRELGLEVEQIVKAMGEIRIKGRFETYELPCGATVVIDYAHNGVSLKAALSALRIYQPNRLICLFGSVGGRTRMRRAELGLVASRDADFCILTSDNPDNENPSAIIAEIASYFTAGSCPYVAIDDRRAAIEYALSHAEQGDIILLAGKGHEAYQIIGGNRQTFSEAEIVQRFCQTL
ncbi:MAG: UDP-N-acetylmuramoyl-L-alanyl-D-glutamate--2,6-diaminopimelate ligase [Clostridia bacterium]|nr:UDP-N-acetylmuramoyl-L-alanyl-D-glutamate--2,6-diaminopimelate ligase [Clostridia bacterium]